MADDRSLKPVLDAITALQGRISSARGLSEPDKIRQTRTLHFLDSVAGVLKAYCDPGVSGEGYYQFEFGKGGGAGH